MTYIQARSILRARQAVENSTHQTGSDNHQIRVTPTALGILIPLFLLCVLGPVVIIFLVKRTRRAALAENTAQSAARKEKCAPLWGREQAREQIALITDVVKCVPGAEKAAASDDARSISEKECAICLCELSMPSLPSPACLMPTPVEWRDTKEELSSSPEHTKKESDPRSSASAFSEADEEILCLRICSHQFHTECLVSWFVLGKYSCPICRTIYYKDPKFNKEEAVIQADRDVEAQIQPGQGARARRSSLSQVASRRSTQEATSRAEWPEGHRPRGLYPLWMPLS